MSGFSEHRKFRMAGGPVVYELGYAEQDVEERHRKAGRFQEGAVDYCNYYGFC